MKNKNKQLSIFDQQSNDNQDFFNKKRSWSASKHRILLKYLQSFCYTFSKDHTKINYVDGFAGNSLSTN